MAIDVHQISSNPDIIAVLESLKEEIREDKTAFARIRQEPHLAEIRLEVDLLQRMLLQEAREKAYQEQALLEKAIKLLEDWKNDSDLKDIIIADKNTTTQNNEKLAMVATYAAWIDSIRDTKTIRDKFLNKYLGYFSSQIKGIEENKESTQSQLGMAAVNSSHSKMQADSLQKGYDLVHVYSSKANTSLMSSFGLMSLSSVVGYLYFSYWGLLSGFLIGNVIFSYFMQNFAYIRGIAAQEVYQALKACYEDKLIEKYFKPVNRSGMELFGIFDASKGDGLLRLISKDMASANNQHQQMEQKKGEYINHLRYLDSRIDWMTEQCLKIKGVSNLTVEQAQKIEKAVTQPEQKQASEADATRSSTTSTPKGSGSPSLPTVAEPNNELQKIPPLLTPAEPFQKIPPLVKPAEPFQKIPDPPEPESVIPSSVNKPASEE